MKLKRIPLMVITLLYCISMFATGVYATWSFATGPVQDVDQIVTLGVKEFLYKPEEVLPGEEYDEAQGNHLVVINNLLIYDRSSGYNVSDYNINGGKKGEQVIHRYINKDGVVYGNYSSYSGGAIKKALAGQDSGAGKVQFMMARVSDTVYEIYTFSQDELDNAEEGSYIEVYKTVLVKEDGYWKSQACYIGEAPTGECSIGSGGSTYSIKHKEWVRT